MIHQLTVPIALACGLFLGLFVFWRKVKYDSGYDEKEAVDGFLVSLFLGWLAGRIGFIIYNFPTFGWQVIRWLDIWHYPGMIEIIALIISGWYLFGWCNRHRFDNWQILDFWATAASLTLAIYEVGQFFAGAGFGFETRLPWGVIYSGAVTPHHPVQLYLAIFYFVLFLYLVRTEYNYRTYNWYRNGRSAAVPGFLTAVSMMAFGFSGCLVLLLRTSQWSIGWFNLDLVLNLIILIWGGRILWIRSGRRLDLESEKKPVGTSQLSKPLPLVTATTGIDEIGAGLAAATEFAQQSETKKSTFIGKKQPPISSISSVVKSPTQIKRKPLPTKFKLK